MKKIDPYHRWLGIPPHEQPPTLYRLLGVSDFESDRKVITEASYRQIGHVKQYASGPNRDAANKILNELAQTQIVLLDPRKKAAYDISIEESDDESFNEDDDSFDAGAVPPIIVQPSETGRSGSFKSSSQVRTKRVVRRKGIDWPTIVVIGAMFSFVAFTAGYWWMNRPAVDTTQASVEAVAQNSVTEESSVDPETPATEPSETTPDATKETPEAIEPMEATERVKAKALKVTPDPVSPWSPESDRDVTGRKAVARKLTGMAKPPVKISGVGTFNCVGFSADGEKIATAENDIVRLSDTTSGKTLHTFRGFSADVESLTFSLDGKRLATVSGGTLQVWNAINGKLIQTLPGEATAVAFTADGKRCVSCSDSVSSVKVWDVERGRLLFNLNCGRNKPCSLAFSPDGRHVACGNTVGKIAVCDANTGKQLHFFEAYHDNESIKSLAFSPDGRQLVSGGFIRKPIKIWDVNARDIGGSEIPAVMSTSNGTQTLAFSLDGSKVLGDAGSGRVQVWDAKTGLHLQKFTFPELRKRLGGVAFASRGRQLITVDADNMLEFWDVDSERSDKAKIANGGSRVKELWGFSAHALSIKKVAFSQDGRLVVTGSADDLVKVWDAQTGQRLKTFARHLSDVHNVEFSRNGERVVGADRYSIRIYDRKSGEYSSFRTVGKMLSAALSQDEKLLIAGTRTGAIELWNPRSTSGEPKIFDEHKLAVLGVAFSPDSKTFASGSTDKTLRIWSTRSRRPLKELNHGSKVRAVGFSPDGTLVASGGDDGTIKIWDVSRGKLVRTIEARAKGHIVHVSFSSDGKRILSAGYSDSTVGIWSVDNGKEIVKINQVTKVSSVAQSVDGNRVVVGSADGTFKMFDVRDAIKK